MRLFKILISAILFIALVFLNSCERATEPPEENLVPNTTVANIPLEGDTMFALQTLHWDGEDDDGYVAGYEYRYITHRVFMGDSVTQEWKFTRETSLVIAFLSDDDLNMQVFQVRSVDNNGAADPTPAQKIFYTNKTVFPVTEIAKPLNNDSYFAIDHVTDWWEGIELNYTARDQEEGGAVVEYAWSVDEGPWHWTKDTAVFIPPSEFKQPLNGEHVIRAISRDNTNLVDPIGDSVVVDLVVPSFDKKILIIDETDENNFPYGVDRPTDSKSDSFYTEVFNPTDNWDFKSQGMPEIDILGQYQLIVWHADDLPVTQPHKLPENIELIKDYLNVGGKFVMSGWRILKSFAWSQPFPLSFKPGDFVHDYLHIINVDETSLEGDCIGFIGVGDIYSDLRIDSTKMIDFPYVIPPNWGMGQINLITQPAGFTDRIYTYKNKDDSPYVQYRGKACGLRYYGSTFDAVILGFPVYFLNKEDAKVMVNEIISNLNLK